MLGKGCSIKVRKVIFTLMELCLVLSLGVAMFGCGDNGGPSPSPTPEPILPSTVIITTAGVGSSGHGWASVLGDAFTDVTGIPISVIPQATDIERYMMMRDGDVQLACASSINGWAPTFGMLEFESWGPQPVYIVWQGSVLSTGVAVRGDDASINSLADLAGKKLNNVVGMASMNLSRDSHLAFAGLTTDDVTLVDVPSYVAAMEALILGTIDAVAVISCTSSGAYDIASSAHGIKWLEMPASDTTGWTGLSEVAPFKPQLCESGAGIDPANPLELSALNNNIYSWGTDIVSEELAYLWAKTIHTKLDEIKDRQPNLPGFTIEQALDFKYSPYPYHPGTIRYFKEIGVWTAEHQTWQDDILAAMEARIGS